MDTLYSFRERNLYSVYFLVFNQNIEIQRKLRKNSLLDVKGYFYFLREDGFDIKNCKTLKNVEKLIIQIAYLILVNEGFYLKFRKYS